MTFTEQLRAVQARHASMLCVGLDPDPQRFPAHLGRDAQAMLDFCAAIVDATADLVACYKPQVAFFEALGIPGLIALAQLQADIERMQRQMESLGAVNLAALDELQAQRERKALLDAQAADLIEAMQTLEAAIKKIDGETRALLGSTFDAVNAHFGRMFPELFGGGRAQLVMTGDEILDAGVEVMAQPPGKKNQTIHLLSGGEKALTAIALVFAIFQLNPAPFCLLDEVDAPLDDANVGRYARLVKEMSEQVQFIYITHNKIAMEMAEQLIGVTMQEQGVSRVVAVDLQDALLTVSNDLERLQRLLASSCSDMGAALYGALAQVSCGREAGGAADPVLTVLDATLRQGVGALQFEDLASQLIAHIRSRLRHSADRLAAATLGDDGEGAALVTPAPLRPNPVTQDEMDAGSIELF